MSSPGSYTVTVNSPCGIAASVPFVIAEYNVSDPVVTGDTVCDIGSVTLSASGHGSQLWYYSLMNYAGTGTSFTTPVISSTATYYVESVDTFPGMTKYTGKADNSGGGSYFNADQSLIFDAYMHFELVSVKVYAQTDSIRNIQLLDLNGYQLQAAAVFIPAGESRIDLNFQVPAGMNHELKIDGYRDLYRNNAGVSYPYEIVDTVSIHNSSGGLNFYYYFYDWEIRTGSASCASNQVPVLAVVEICNEIKNNVDLSNSIAIYPNPAAEDITFSVIIPGTTDIRFIITDLIGKSVYAKDFKNASGQYTRTIHLAGISRGIYFANVIIENRVYVRKLVIE